MLINLTKYTTVAVVTLSFALAPQLCWAQQTTSSEAATWSAPSYKAKKANPVSTSAASVRQGKQIYEQQCLVCHGPGGKGDGPASVALTPSPASLIDPVIQRQSDGSFFWKISTGRTPMPAFEAIVSEENRWNVINYLRSLASVSAGTAEGTSLANQKPQGSNEQEAKR